jgi:hypothetical protein
MSKKSKTPRVVEISSTINVPANFEVQAAGYTLNTHTLSEMSPTAIGLSHQRRIHDRHEHRDFHRQT